MNIFICYDTNQKKYFSNNGFNDIVYGLHPKTLKPFWIYERNENFDNCFEKWLDRKRSSFFSVMKEKSNE